jgi:hypothetical protein
MDEHGRAIKHTRSYNMWNHPKQTTMWSCYTFLQDISIEILGYSHQGHFDKEKWDKEWQKAEGSTTSCWTMRAMSCTSSSCEEIGSVQLLPHTWCIIDADRAMFWNYGLRVKLFGLLGFVGWPKIIIKVSLGNKQHTLIYTYLHNTT